MVLCLIQRMQIKKIREYDLSNWQVKHCWQSYYDVANLTVYIDKILYPLSDFT